MNLKVFYELFGEKNDYVFYKIIPECSKNLSVIFDKMNKDLCSECIGNCCKQCNINNGHFTHPKYYTTHLSLEKMKEKYKFSKRFGFFNDNKKQCTLSRELRSSVCLNYTCEKMNKIIDLKTKYEINKNVKIIELVKKECLIPF
jgi:hypothetical protein